MVTKALTNPFFDASKQGCMDKARALGATCLYVGPEEYTDDEDGAKQASFIDDLVKQKVDGIAVAVRQIETVGPAIDRAVEAGIPVVTFDSDAPESRRTTYVGTDNYFFGETIAKVLKQLVPNGGTYGVIAHSSPNLQERLRGFEDEILKDGLWTPVQGSPSDYKSNLTLIIEQMNGFAQQNATAVVPVMGAAMRSGGWKEFVDKHRDSGMKFVSGDAMANQLEFLDRGFAHGLVGQLPYEMGFLALEILNGLIEEENVYPDIIGTNVLTHILVPLVLPELVVDHNLIGNLHIVGYILCGIVTCVAAFFLVWILRSRKLRVIQAAQPGFLLMVIVGVFFMGLSMIPLSFDDNGSPESISDRDGSMICMTVPWSACLGFVTCFSALYAKTRRVNKIFHSKEHFRRVTVTQREVMVPFLVLFLVNVILLTLWTVYDPLTYVRTELPGMDGWNRIIATYGSCQSDNVLPFLLPIAAVNIGILVFANWEAYEARDIMTEFSESKYIAMAMASLLQASLTGIPILFVVRESPEAFYLVLVFIIFVVCISLLLLIFVPKVILAEEFSRQTPAQQNRAIRESIINSTGPRPRCSRHESGEFDSGYESGALNSRDEGSVDLRESAVESDKAPPLGGLEKVEEEADAPAVS